MNLHAGLFMLVTIDGKRRASIYKFEALSMASTVYCCELQATHAHNIDVGVSDDILRT